MAVFEFFEDIKQQVDITREEVRQAIEKDITDKKVLEEVDGHPVQLNEGLTKFQEDSMTLVEKMEPWFDETFLKDLKALIEKIETETIDESQFVQVNKQILELKFKCEKMLNCEDQVDFLTKRHQGAWALLHAMYSYIIPNILSKHKIEPIQYFKEVAKRAWKQNSRIERELSARPV